MAKADIVLLKSEYSLIVLLAIALIVVFSSQLALTIQPNGATINVTRTETANSSTAGQHQAQAGNVTELNIFAYSTTQSWQGYFGNISGTIQLADANSRAMYNWSLANPQGEVYASTNSSISWSNIQCFNYTATGTFAGGETPGEVSRFGTNLTALESRFGINSSDVDGINETFNLVHGGAGQHDLFYTANRQFSEGECISTRIFSNAGIGENDKFEEVLLYEPTTTSVIFASIIEQNLAGFDNRAYDFQMLVPENGHDADTSTTTYYFFVELE